MHAISIFLFVLSGIAFVAAVIFFFVFNIPMVIGDLSGHNAKKAIKDIERHSKETGHLHKNYRYDNRSITEDSPSNMGVSTVNTDNTSSSVRSSKPSSSQDIVVKNVRSETGVLSTYNPSSYKPNTSVIVPSQSGSYSGTAKAMNNREEITREVPSVNSNSQQAAIHTGAEQAKGDNISSKKDDERRNAEQAAQFKKSEPKGDPVPTVQENDKVTLEFANDKAAEQHNISSDSVTVMSDVKDEKFKVIYELGFYESEEIIE